MTGAIDQPAAPVPGPPPEKGWWATNWMWLVPITIFGSGLLCSGCAWTVIYLIFGMMKDSVPYQDVLDQARASKAVQQAMGTPIKAGLLVSGNININGNAGNANLTIPISGPKGSGTMNVVATRTGGKWVFATLTVDVHGGSQTQNPPGRQKIDVLAGQ